MTVPDPITLGHNQTYQWSDDRGITRAVCSCGWEGPWRVAAKADKTDTDIVLHRLGVERRALAVLAHLRDLADDVGPHKGAHPLSTDHVVKVFTLRDEIQRLVRREGEQ